MTLTYFLGYAKLFTLISNGSHIYDGRVFVCMGVFVRIRTLSYKGATSWYNLPVEMRLIQTYNQFKNMQKKKKKSSMK